MPPDAEQILAFRFAQSGLAERAAGALAGAAACPASDFSRGAALLALGARHETVDRAAFDAAVADGSLVVAHVMRGAIHAVDPADFARYGRAPLATDDDELGAQIGQQLQRISAESQIPPSAALAEVAAATADALKGGAALDRTALHQALRERVRPELMPWCKSCESHHVAPMLWRFAGVKAGARLDEERRYVQGRPGRTPAASSAVEGFLRFYGPATPGDFAEWAGLSRDHARRLWDRAGGLAEVTVGKRSAWLREADRAALDDPQEAAGTRLLPPGDPYLQKPNRPLLAPDRDLRKALFRPVASPGAVLVDGRLAGLWRVRAKGKEAAVEVERLGPRIRKRELTEEAQRVAALRGEAEAVVTVT